MTFRLADPEGRYTAVRLCSDLPLTDRERSFARDGDEWVLRIQPPRPAHRHRVTAAVNDSWNDGSNRLDGRWARIAIAARPTASSTTRRRRSAMPPRIASTATSARTVAVCPPATITLT